MRLETMLLAGSALALVAGAAQAGETLNAVKQKGFVQCGVSSGLAGFSNTDDAGNWSGLDVDLCRSVAAALFGDATKVKYTPLTAKERFTALQSGEVDLLSRNTTWTSNRDSAQGFDFVAVNYYDGQGFMVLKTLGVSSALELDGASVCVQSGTTTELNLADYFRANNMTYDSVVFERNDQVRTAYEQGRCDAYTTDQSGLYAERTALPNPDDHIILPEVISKEPLGPLVRHGDNEWGDIVRWTHFAMLDAEELGITSANVKEMAQSTENPEIRRLLGTEGELGKDLGLSGDWVVQIVSQVGNYGEVFEKNVGSGSPLKIARGLNALWTEGGLQYGMPVR